MDKGDSRYPEPDELRARKAADAAHAELAPPPQEDPPALSGLVVWLARKLDTDPQKLARRMPPDTLRRTKYPFASEQLADGTTRFRSIGIVERKQLIHAPVTPGSRRDEHRGGIEVNRKDGRDD